MIEFTSKPNKSLSGAEMDLIGYQVALWAKRMLK